MDGSILLLKVKYMKRMEPLLKPSLQFNIKVIKLTNKFMINKTIRPAPTGDISCPVLPVHIVVLSSPQPSLGQPNDISLHTCSRRPTLINM